MAVFILFYYISIFSLYLAAYMGSGALQNKLILFPGQVL